MGARAVLASGCGTDIITAMRIIVAPDSFKGTATAAEAAAGISAGLHEVLGDATVATLPMADGGEGTAEVLAEAAVRRGEAVSKISLPATDAAGRLIEACYFFNKSDQTAYIDVAAATGLPAVADLLGADRLDAKHNDSFGTGVLIADAQSRGATRIVLGLGGSASVDGGSGILSALGAPAHDGRGYALPAGGAPLVQLDTFDTAQVNVKAAMLDYMLLADTECPPAQSAIVFGPQKGASRSDVALLTGALLRLCEQTGIDPARTYFGAAGAIPVGLTWLSSVLWGSEDHIQVHSGADYVAQAVGLDEHIAQADLVITGEGSFDAQSLSGKAVGAIAAKAQAAGTPLAVVAGRIDATTALPPGTLTAELGADSAAAGRVGEALRAAGRDIATRFSRAASE